MSPESSRARLGVVAFFTVIHARCPSPAGFGSTLVPGRTDMNMLHSRIPWLAIVVLALFAAPASAHCDSLDGPVVADARAALLAADPQVVLKWIDAADEAELLQAFDRTLSVRDLGDDARELADLYFFETLVRLHRASEGAPYQGLRPAGAPRDPVVEATERALASGSPDELVKMLTVGVEEGVRTRLTEVLARRRHVERSVDEGRVYVQAYVDLFHYVLHLREGLPPGDG